MLDDILGKKLQGIVVSCQLLVIGAGKGTFHWQLATNNFHDNAQVGMASKSSGSR